MVKFSAAFPVVLQYFIAYRVLGVKNFPAPLPIPLLVFHTALAACEAVIAFKSLAVCPILANPNPPFTSCPNLLNAFAADPTAKASDAGFKPPCKAAAPHNISSSNAISETIPAV